MWPNENTINAAQPFAVSVQKAPAQGDVAFLLGAGASVEAQVPDTVHLIQDFAEQTTWATQIQTLLKELREWAKTQGRVVDVELVLETLQRLADWPPGTARCLTETTRRDQWDRTEEGAGGTAGFY